MCLLRYNVACSLDGYIASPDGSTPWIVDDPSIDFNALYAEFGSFIMGRKTWDTMLAYGEANPLRALTDADFAILSSSLDPAAADDPGQRVSILRTARDAIDWVKAKKGSQTKDIWLFGGGGVCQLMLEAGIVDKIEVAIMPVVLGSGIKMIIENPNDPNGVPEGRKLRLDSTRVLGSGIILCSYTVSSTCRAVGE